MIREENPSNDGLMIILSHTTRNPQKRARLIGGVGKTVPGAELRFVESGGDVAKIIIGAEIMLTYRFEPEWLASSDALRWIHIGGAGVDHIRSPRLLDSNIIITNSRGIHARIIAEYVLGAMLHFSQRFDCAWKYRIQRNWRAAKEPMTQSSFTLKDKKAGIIGGGSIGGGVGEMCAKMGMSVFVLTRIKRESLPYAEITGGSEDIDSLLKWADFVVVSLPLTGETKGLLDARRISLMKPSACLINISRGGIVDETALAEALKENHIAGAGLDVFETEPLPENSPLFNVSNLLLTPHIAGNYPEYTIEVIDLFLKNLKRYAAGEPLMNTVDLRRGY